MVTRIDRGHYRIRLADPAPTRDGTGDITAMKARELGRGKVVVGDRVAVVGDVSGRSGTLARMVRIEPRRTLLRGILIIVCLAGLIAPPIIAQNIEPDSESDFSLVIGAGFAALVLMVVLTPRVTPALERTWTALFPSRSVAWHMARHSAAYEAGRSSATVMPFSLAIGLVAGLAHEGIRVPQDISVVGVDDHPHAPGMIPALTTVRLDFASVGEAAARLALGVEAGPVVEVPTQLVVRGSTAPPP